MTSQNSVKIMILGDVVGSAGVACIVKHLHELKRREGADVVIVNAENSATGNGMDVKSAEAIFSAGADVLTGGNHTLKRHEIFDYLDDHKNALRPINLPTDCPGNGSTVISIAGGLKLMVVSLLGQIFMDPSNSPFAAMDALLERQKGNYDICIADLHAEATSEKAAFARYFDGRINGVFGTHTHVQTSDARILKNGTAFVTDIGMCGSEDSILGVKSEAVIKNFVTRIHDRFEAAENDCRLSGALVELNISTKCAIIVNKVKLLKYPL